MAKAQEMHRSVARIDYQKATLDIHYRYAGNKSSSPIVLLHPSPLSSNFMMPLLHAFAVDHYAIAWDAPGYGDSSKLPEPDRSLNQYVDCLAKFLDTLDIESAVIYGNATGAQVAIEFAKKHPDKTVKLVLENAAWFYDDERNKLLANYFPDLTPKTDGQHLKVAWEIVNNLFRYFPWYDESEQAKLKTPMPPAEVLQATLIDYLKAGTHYADAYIAALNNERPEQLQGIGVPTDIVLWQDSIIYPFCQRLQSADLPKNIVIHLVASGMENRIEQLLMLLDKS